MPFAVPMVARFAAVLVALAFLVSTGSFAAATPHIAGAGGHAVISNGHTTDHPSPSEFLQAAPSETNRLYLSLPKGFGDDEGAYIDLIHSGDIAFPQVDFQLPKLVVSAPAHGEGRAFRSRAVRLPAPEAPSTSQRLKP